MLVDHLLFAPDSSLVKQTFMPRKLHMLNLAGFGMMAWDRSSHDPEQPFRYASTALPVFDRNLESLGQKISAHCLLAHVRGVAYGTHVEISTQNTHPFCFPGYRVAFAHNGDLYRVGDMKEDLLKHVRPEIARLITGTTDSELMYALLLSHLEDPRGRPTGDELRAAIEQTLRTIRDCRERHGVSISSSANLFVTTGEEMCAVRYCFDFGRYNTTSPDKVHEANLSYLSLWYTSGREFGYHEGEWKMIGGSDTADSIIVASEPLTVDTTSWLEVPEYSMIWADTSGGQVTIESHSLDI